MLQWVEKESRHLGCAKMLKQELNKHLIIWNALPTTQGSFLGTVVRKFHRVYDIAILWRHVGPQGEFLCLALHG